MPAFSGLACALIVSACQTQAPCVVGLATRIPFSVNQGHLGIQPLLNDQMTNMWLDTGDQMTTLTLPAAKRLSLRLEPLMSTSEGIGGHTQNYGFVARSLQLGRLHGRNFELLAADMGAPGQNALMDGLIGSDFLAAYDVDIDVANHEVVLYAAKGRCSQPTVAISGDLYVVPMVEASSANDHRPHVSVQIAGHRLTALLDTGAPNSALFGDAASRIGLDAAAFRTDVHFRAGGVGRQMRAAVRHVLTPVTLGDITISNLPVSIIDQPAPADTDMLLGMDFMSRVHTWLSFSTGKVVLQYPAWPVSRPGQ